MYAILVADVDIDPYGAGEPELVGPFQNEADAKEWAYKEQRWIVTVLPIQMRANTP